MVEYSANLTQQNHKVHVFYPPMYEVLRYIHIRICADGTPFSKKEKNSKPGQTKHQNRHKKSVVNRQNKHSYKDQKQAKKKQLGKTSRQHLQTSKHRTTCIRVYLYGWVHFYNQDDFQYTTRTLSTARHEEHGETKCHNIANNFLMWVNRGTQYFHSHYCVI